MGDLWVLLSGIALCLFIYFLNCQIMKELQELTAALHVAPGLLLILFMVFFWSCERFKWLDSQRC